MNFFPTNADLKKGFDESILINKQSAGVIYFIESIVRNRNKHSTQLLGFNKYSLEHLMPKKWENNWGKLTKTEERANRNKKILTLGNLAIITQSLNISIRDSSWKTKKEGLPNKPGLLHFSAGIETLAPFLSIEEWNETEIQNRANFLFEKALDIWQYEEPVSENE